MEDTPGLLFWGKHFAAYRKYHWYILVLYSTDWFKGRSTGFSIFLSIFPWNMAVPVICPLQHTKPPSHWHMVHMVYEHLWTINPGMQLLQLPESPSGRCPSKSMARAQLSQTSPGLAVPGTVLREGAKITHCHCYYANIKYDLVKVSW